MWLDRLQAWIENGMPCALATVIEAEGPVPRKPGAKMVVAADGTTEGSVGGGFVEHRCLQEAARVIAERSPATLRFVLDGTDWREGPGPGAAALAVFIEPIVPAKEIVLFGGGHVAQHLARLAAAAGIPVRVFDERPGFACRERFPAARDLVCAPYAEAASRIRLSSVSHCLVATHGHAHDEQVLEQFLGTPDLPYIGMVGSARKLQGIRERLAARGLAMGPQVYSPAGLALGGSLPADIALAILAEIKLVMEGGRPEHLRK